MNRFCGSGLAAFNALAHAIAAGSVDVGVAGGVESMSRSTWPIRKPPGARYVGPVGGRDAMFSGAGGPQHPVLEADGTMIEMPQGAQLIADELGVAARRWTASPSAATSALRRPPRRGGSTTSWSGPGRRRG